MQDVLDTLLTYNEDVAEIKATISELQSRLNDLSGKVITKKSAVVAIEGKNVSVTPKDSDLHIWSFVWRDRLHDPLISIKKLNGFISEWFRTKPNPEIIHPPTCVAHFSSEDVWVVILGCSATHVSQEDYPPTT